MKPRLLSASRLSFPLAIAIAAMLAAPAAIAQTNRYWDPASSGNFGTVDGTITWTSPLNIIWTNSNNGSTTRLGNYITTLTDILNFGGPTASLGVSNTTPGTTNVIPVGTVNAGSLSFNTLGGNLILSGGTITLAASSTITTVNASQAHTVTSVLAGAGTSLTKAGAGTLVLSGANTYVGQTIISSGTLVLNNTQALGGSTPGTNGTSSISMAAGTTLRADLTDLSTAAPITLSGAGNITIANGTNTAVNASYGGGITGTTGTLTFSVGNATGNPAHVITLGATSDYEGNTIITTGNSANNLTVRSGAANALSPTTVLTMDGGVGSGSGRTITFDLNGNNQTLAGLETVANYSTYTARNQRVTSSTAATLTINGSVDSSYGGVGASSTFSGNPVNPTAIITGAISLVKEGSGTFTLAGANTYTGDTSIGANAGTLSISGSSGSLGGGAYAGAISIGTGSTFQYSSNATQTLNGNITGGGALLKDTNTATLTLSGINTYTGGTTITAGTLATSLPDNLAEYTNAGKVIFNGGRLNVSSGDGTTTGWTAAQVATLLSNATKTSGTLGINTANGDVTETAFDFGGLSLVKTGANTLTLTQAHTLGGTTIVNNGGTVQITDAGALGAGAVSILMAGTNTGTLELALTGTNTITNNFTTSSASTLSTSGANAHILNTSGDNTLSGDITLTNTGGSGTNIASDGGLLTLSGTITHTIASTRTFSIGGSGDGVVSGSVNNNSTGNVALSLAKSGAGTWTLSNASNTYTGTTTVSGGSLIINGAVASTSVVVNASLGGSGTMANATLSGSGSINPGNSPGIMTAAATNPTGGLDYNFEFSTEGTAPTWSNAAASVNDLLRLTSATPFTAALGGTNQITLYLGVTSLNEGDVFTGGFFTDNSADFIASIDSAVFRYFLADGTGSETYNGNNYTEYTGPLGISRSTVLVDSADFAGGTVTDGYVTQFTIIPEPSAALLGGLGALLLLRRRRA